MELSKAETAYPNGVYVPAHIHVNTICYFRGGIFHTL